MQAVYARKIRNYKSVLQPTIDEFYRNVFPVLLLLSCDLIL